MPLTAAAFILLTLTAAADAPPSPPVERVSTAAPFPRGLAVVDGEMFVLCRGRVRGAGGVSAEIEDQAGTIYAIDTAVSEPVGPGPVGPAVRGNGRVVARPTSPPFILWDRTADPPESDRHTDRPYCTLRYHEPTRSLYVCAFSGVDLPQTPADPVAFSKNRSDAILRFDLRTGTWHEVERHRLDAPHRYPHHDPAVHPPPHGWLEGPDNCLPLGRWLYAVSKDNSRLVRYDLSGLEASPHAGPPPGEVVIGSRVHVSGLGERVYEGHSGLAFRDGWLYLACRTSSVILRLRLDDRFDPVRPLRPELIALFEPFDPVSRRSADLTDLAFDDAGRLYVVSALPARVYRLRPDPDRVFDARGESRRPWLDLAAVTGRPRTKSENILYHDGWLYVTSGDGYGDPTGAEGTIYRVKVES